MEPIYCPKCGALNAVGSIFCVKCGAQLSVDNSQQKVTEEHEHNFKTDGNAHSNSILLLTLGWLSAAVSIFFIPTVFGGTGVALGFVERRVNTTQGTILIIASIVCGILGVII